jgi:hypothetical protein
VKGESSFDHEISSVETGSGKGKVDTSYHKVSEWFALPDDERKKILAAQDQDRNGSKNGQKRNGRKGKGKGRGGGNVDGKSKQKLAVLASELLDAFEEDDGEGSGNGNGGSGSSVKKKKSAVESSPADHFGCHKNAVVHFARGLQEFGGKTDERLVVDFLCKVFSVSVQGVKGILDLQDPARKGYGSK